MRKRKQTIWVPGPCPRCIKRDKARSQHYCRYCISELRFLRISRWRVMEDGTIQVAARLENGGIVAL